MKRILYAVMLVLAFTGCKKDEPETKGPEKKSINVEVTVDLSQDALDVADLQFSYVSDSKGTIAKEPIKSLQFKKTVTIPGNSVDWSCQVECTQKSSFPEKESYELNCNISFLSYGLMSDGEKIRIEADDCRKEATVKRENLETKISRGTLNFVTTRHFSF